MIWEDVQGRSCAKFFDLEGLEVPIEGLNLVQDVEINEEGFSDWMTPIPGILNSSSHLSKINLGEKEEGDYYTCQLDIEFLNVSAIEGREFRIWPLGAVDDKWTIGNVWSSDLFWMNNPPQSGLYHFESTIQLSKEMAEASEFNIDIRCDYWNSGSFRVGNFKIEKGNNATPWTPGI